MDGSVKTQYYTYVHFVEDTRPIYVGKGIKKRAFSYKKNKYYNNAVAKYGIPKCIAIKTSSEEEALFLEESLVIFFKSLGYKLTNITNGGDKGTTGYKYESHVVAKIQEKIARWRETSDKYKEIVKWHSSPEGKKYHSELGKLAWERREKKYYTIICVCCGKPKETIWPERTKYCSRSCQIKQNQWDRGAVKRQLYDKVCLCCQQVFQTTLPMKTNYCSPRCRLYHKARLAGKPMRKRRIKV